MDRKEKWSSTTKYLGLWALVSLGSVFLLPPWAAIIVFTATWIYVVVNIVRAWRRRGE
jgi:hypothetical protein